MARSPVATQSIRCLQQRDGAGEHEEQRDHQRPVAGEQDAGGDVAHAAGRADRERGGA